VQNPY